MLKPVKILTKNYDTPDSHKLQVYQSSGGYEAARKALGMTRDQVVDEVKKANLRGRGGAGFPMGVKWGFMPKDGDKPSYLVINADEGEPGTFKDRTLMERDPHRIIEGCIIGCYGVGAHTAYIYVRHELHLSKERLWGAIHEARAQGFLGPKPFGVDYPVDVFVHTGAGAYICGEETALIESIEGKPGRPRFKPPYPPVAGLYQKPTVVNNVETFANVPWIILNGPKAFKKIGTASSSGTKVFTLVGNIRNRGLVEVPMGTTAYDLVYRYGGGLPGGKDLKMVQTGGTAGTFVRPDQLNVKLDFDSGKLGVSIGSGVILAMDTDTCAVEAAKVAMEFFEHESCGKCTPCREGTRLAVSILDSISKGKGKESDLDLLLSLADTMEETSFCGLGQAVPMPLRSIIENFREEFLRHIRKEPCPVCVYEKPKKRKAGSIVTL